MNPGRPLRVCHVITGLERGGAEAMLVKLCRALPANRVHSRVIALRNGGPLAADLRDAGVEVVEVGLRPGGLPGIAAMRMLWQALRTPPPDVVQGWMYHGNLAASVFRPASVPVIWNIRQTLYDLREEKPNTRAVIRLLAKLSPRPAAIVYNSRVSAAQHAAAGFDAGRTIILPNGFDTTQFIPRPGAAAALRSALGIPASALLVGLMARAHPMKDHATFFAAAERVAAAVADVHFVLAGEGTADGQFAELARRHGVGKRTHLLGARRDMAHVTAALDVACCASAWGEGFPNVLGEALAAGVATVTTDVGDAADVVGDAGRVVPVGDAAAFADAILDLLRNPQARADAGRVGRERVVREFALTAVAARYAALYESVAKGGGPDHTSLRGDHHS